MDPAMAELPPASAAAWRAPLAALQNRSRRLPEFEVEIDTSGIPDGGGWLWPGSCFGGVRKAGWG